MMISAALPMPSVPEDPRMPSPRREMDDEPTAVLLDGAQRGDQRSMEVLLQRYAPRLRRWASGRLPLRARDAEDTDDLVQEALIQSIGRLGNLRKQEAFLGYLRTAVMNRIRNHVRHAEVRERGNDHVPTPSAEASPLERLIGNDALDRYEAALAAMTDADRSLIMAHVELDLSMAELADLTGRPTANAARMALQRALVRLAKAMGETTGRDANE